MFTLKKFILLRKVFSGVSNIEREVKDTPNKNNIGEPEKIMSRKEKKTPLLYIKKALCWIRMSEESEFSVSNSLRK
jgi:hypothetical protein